MSIHQVELKFEKKMNEKNPCGKNIETKKKLKR